MRTRSSAPAWAVAAVLWAAAPSALARCADAVAVLPFDALAVERSAAGDAEAAVRRTLEELAPGCVEPRKETIARLKASGGQLPACGDDACRAQWVRKLGARWLFRGIAIGAGGGTSVSLSLWGEKGESGRQVAGIAASTPATHDAPDRAGPVAGSNEITARGAAPSRAEGEGPSTPPGGAPAPVPPSASESRTAENVREIARSVSAAGPVSAGALGSAVRTLWVGRTPRLATRDLGVLPHVTVGAGVAAVAGAVILGLQAQRTASSVSTGNAGCPPETFATCFQDRLAMGRAQAQWSNVLWVTGGVLTAGGALMFVWKLP